MDLYRWFSGGDFVPGMPHDVLWAYGTIILSGLVILGYCAIAINWYFQKKVSSAVEARKALNRLISICACCAICGGAFYAIESPWLVWRGYDIVLLMLVLHTWSFVWRMRGLGLVNERLAQTDELERSAERYRDIAQLLPHMVWTATADGQVDFSNERWRQYVGDHRSWLHAIHPDDQQQAVAAWNKAVAAREPVTIEARLGEGEHYRTFVVRATPLVRGDAVKWLGACADIEDQKLLAAQKEMQARQKSFFLNALSHDIRAPLHNVLLNAHLLKMSAREADDRESVEMIIENAVAAGDLVTRLLDFAKVGAHDHNMIENLSLADLLQQIARRFRPVAEQKGLYLRLSGAADAAVLSDRQKLERIISNLVDNAIKYTSRGGVDLVLVASDAGVSLRICDSGLGIPKENIPYLFDEFYQVNNYERDRSKGFGMGLAICKSLAHHIGCDVRLAGTGPDGSCFEVLIKGHGAGCGGRPGSQDRDRADPEEAGLCRV